MTLADVVSRFEAGVPREGDFGHDLASLVMEELAHCEESEQQAVLFADARKVSDELLAQYLRLDQEDKWKIAQVYASEKSFRKIGGVYSGTRYSVIKKLGAKNLKLLLHISNYSKLITVLENYVRFVEQSVVNIRNSTLSYYLTHYTPNGKKARRNSTKGSLYRFCQYDFRADKRFDRQNAKAIFESLTWGVPDELRQKVRDAASLKPLRERILENYVRFVEESNDININTSGLPYYFSTHDIGGRKVKKFSNRSLVPFYHCDFRTLESSRKLDSQSVFESLALGVDEDLKQRVRDAMSLLPVRRRILESYVRFVEESDDIKVATSGLYYYLHNYNLQGKKARKSSESLASFYAYDFRNRRVLDKICAGDIFESLTFGVSDELKQSVRDAMSLLPARKKILGNYVRYIEQNPHIMPVHIRLSYYLNNHNLKGEKVRPGSKDSLNSFYIYNFKSKKRLRKLSDNLAFESLAFGVSDGLKQSVRDAMSLLPVRTMILQNYVGYIEGSKDAESLNSSLRYYLMSHNIKGEEAELRSKESLRRFYEYDYKNQRGFRKKSTRLLFKSLTHGIKDKVLVEKVMRYSGVAA